MASALARRFGLVAACPDGPDPIFSSRIAGSRVEALPAACARPLARPSRSLRRPFATIPSTQAGWERPLHQPSIPTWRRVVLGAIALAGALGAVGCHGWGAPGLQIDTPDGCDRDLLQAAIRATDATDLIGGGVMFYIGEEEWVTAGEHVQPTTRRRFLQWIGRDAETGLVLLRGPGRRGIVMPSKVEEIRFADVAPPVGTPLIAAGYRWDAPPPLNYIPGPDSCRLPPPTSVPLREGVTTSQVMRELTPHVLEGTVIDVLPVDWILYLRHDMASTASRDGQFRVGGPIVTAAGDVVGVLGAGPRPDLAVTPPAIAEALARIRAAASD